MGRWRAARVSTWAALLALACAGAFAPPVLACHDRPPLVRSSTPADAAARVASAVVNVVTLREPEESGAGLVRIASSGFVLEPNGAIVATAHAMKGARQVFVTLPDGRQLPAEVVGADPRSDVALLQVKARGLPSASVADRALCAGDVVVAVGSPFGFDTSVSAGVVSAPERLVPLAPGLPFIQMDVALNPGSSGGPVADLGGAVVGMSSMVYSDSGVYMGVSFAVPIARILRVVAELRRRGGAHVDIGLVTQALSPDLARAFGLTSPQGALVASVDPGSAASAAGVRTGDVVLAVDGRTMAGPKQVEDAVATGQRETISLELWRSGRRIRVPVQARATRESVAAVPAPSPQAEPEQRLGLMLAPARVTAKMPLGVYVDSVSGSSLLAGIEPGDRITAINGTEVASVQDLDAALARVATQDVIAVLVWRSDIPIYMPVRRIDR